MLAVPNNELRKESFPNNGSKQDAAIAAARAAL
jgi:hypothetical protein